MMAVAHVTSPIRFTTLRPTRSTSADFAIVAICQFGCGRLSDCSRSQIGRLVYAFYGRVDAYARQHAKPVAQVLGHVMAHELGHLLLPHGSHAKSGIMTAAWDRKQIEQIGRGWLSFTSEQ